MDEYTVDIDFLINYIIKKIEKENYVLENDKDLWGYSIGSKEALSSVLKFLERIKRDLVNNKNT